MNAPVSPRVSVCIANYNGESMLADCIESVLAQDTEATIEILVHDDASGDESLALLGNRFPGVQVIASSANVGFCVANNRMVAAAQGDYILLLNNDAALARDAVRTLVQAAESGAGTGILTLPQFDWESGKLVDRGCLLDPFYTPVPNLDPSREDVAYVIGACMFLPRSCWNELGGFPEWFGSIAEDMHLCCVARLRGVPVRVVSGSSYRHRQGASFGGNRVTNGRLASRFGRRYLSERNRLLVLFSCSPGALVWPCLALHASSMAAEGLILALASRSMRPLREVYLAALKDAWRLRAEACSERRRQQRLRTTGPGAYLDPFVWKPHKLSLFFRHGIPAISD